MSDSEETSGQFYDARSGDMVNNGKYKLIHHLGNGTFSRVWLTLNTENNGYYALKITSCFKDHYVYALDELKILEKLKQKESSEEWKKLSDELKVQATHVVQLFDHFTIQTQQGNHLSLVFELLGPTLLDLIQYQQSQGKVMKISTVKSITKQILSGLAFTHMCKIVHTDIKPENVMVALTEQQKSIFLNSFINQDIEPSKVKKIKTNGELQGTYYWHGIVPISFDSLEVKIVDYGCACFDDQQFEEISTKEYKSIEAIIKAPYNTSTDIWSLGCLVYEMLTNNYLFKPEGQDETDEADDHLASMIEILGPIPQEVLEQGSRTGIFFNQQGQLIRYSDLEPTSLSESLVVEFRFRLQESRDIEEFILYLLQWDPKKRPSPTDSLQHKWLIN